MLAEEVKQLIEEKLAGATAWVQSADNYHFDAIVICALFTNKSKVAQQQMVYHIVNDQIKAGEIHALSLKTYTPEAWDKMHG